MTLVRYARPIDERAGDTPQHRPEHESTFLLLAVERRGLLVPTDAMVAAFALIKHTQHMKMKPKNTICPWFDKDALDAAQRSWTVNPKNPCCYLPSDRFPPGLFERRCSRLAPRHRLQFEGATL